LTQRAAIIMSLAAVAEKHRPYPDVYNIYYIYLNTALIEESLNRYSRCGCETGAVS
jgi:hypothetical protein